MERKILISLLGICLVLIGGCASSEDTNQNIDFNAVENSGPCQGLDETACFEKPNCQGQYGPSSCSGEICTTDEAFERCVVIDQAKLVQAEKDRELCEETQGEWKNSRFKKIGSCDCPQYSQVGSASPEQFHTQGRIRFIQEEGCVSSKDACERINGQWREPLPSKTVQREDITQERCVSTSIYSLMTWDEDQEHCILSTFDSPSPKCIFQGKQVDPFTILTN